MERIDAYRTPDGRVHMTEYDAMLHVTDKACEAIATRLDNLKPDLGAANIYKITVALAGDYESLLKLTRQLNSITRGTRL